MKLIEIYHQFFRISGDDGVYYCTNADTDAALNVKAVHHVRTDATELPYDFRMLPPLTLRGRDIEKIKPLHKGLGMPYTPISKRVNILKTQTPDSMGYESHRALDKIQKAVGGDTTNFVCERLQWTREQIKERLFAEQVDAVALIIYNFEARHQSVIIGDQTGIGKGRVASSIIRYAVVQGLIPVYCTENTGLFSDNYRDLCDIGCSDLEPFIINSSTSGKTDASIKTLDENDKQVTVYRPIADKKVKEKIYKSGKMPKGYDYILTTYSQLKNAYHKEKDGNITNGEDYLKYSFLKDIAPNAVFIFDESHNISGSKIVQRDWWDPDSGLVLAGSNQFTCFNELCKASSNSVFLSATFAKQPQNMIIYANRTCIAEAGLQESQLVGAIANGGEALQEIISANIVSEGQMIRRESIYKDIEVNYITLDADNAQQYGTPDLEKEHRGMCDYITDLLNQINEFEQTYVIPVIEEINKTTTADIQTSKTDHKLGVGHTPLFSKLFQIVNQLLFAIKAEAVAEHAIRRLGEGKKVVIAVSSTMEAFIKSLEDDDNKGEEISCDFALVLDRALENTLKIVRNGEGDFHEKDTIAIDLLPPEGQDMYMAIRENIVNAVSNICISPIDLIISRIEDAVNPETGENYVVTEVTGRSKKIQFSNPECTAGYIVPRPPVKRNVAFSEFQNNQSDVLIINTSGATGASAHATVKNTNLRPEQVKPRCMIIAQTELDIDKEVQKRGRVNRTGQIYLPTYDYLISAIPAEQRLMMMLQKKLKSLDANSTSNQKQSKNIIDVLDFFNKYGDQVAYEYLEDNPDINRKLNNPLGLDENGDKPKSKNNSDDDSGAKKDFVKRISGYVPLLTCEEQADFYDSISSNYKKLVDELKKKGEYDLEVESMDLDAKLVGSLKILQPASSGNSCFSDAVYQGIYSCKVLRKPYTKEQVATFVQTNTKGGDAQAMAKQTADEYAAYYENEKQQAADNLTKKAEERKQSVREVNAKKDGDAKVIEQDINQKCLEIDNETAETIKNRSFKFDALKRRARFIKYFYAGRACIIEGDHDTKAICLGIEIGNKTKNKFAPSNITITFAVANSIKEMSLTLVDKDITKLEAIMGLSTLDEYADSRFLENWSEYVKESTADREQRNFIVGNLLKGYKNAPEKSKLISFTTHDGEVMKGILTPKDTDGSNTAKVIAAKYSIKECGWVIMDAIRSRNSKNFTLTRGMEIRTTPNGTITLVCSNSETFKHLKDVPEWQQISDSGRGFDVQTQYGKKIWMMSVSDPARLLDLLEEYNFSVEFFPTEAQLYFGDRGNDALKKGDWPPLPTDPSNIPTWNYISPLLENEIKLLKLRFKTLSGADDLHVYGSLPHDDIIISKDEGMYRRGWEGVFGYRYVSDAKQVISQLFKYFYPELKFTIGVNKAYRSLTITVISSPCKEDSPELQSLLDELTTVAFGFSYNFSDGMIDYYDSGFHAQARISEKYQQNNLAPHQEFSVEDMKEVVRIINDGGTLLMPKPNKQQSPAAVPGTPSDLAIIHYTDKAIVLTGDTKPFKDQIKALGGKFGSHFDTSKVPSGIGWLFPKTKLAEVQAFVAKHGKTTASPLFDNEIALLKLKSGK